MGKQGYAFKEDVLMCSLCSKPYDVPRTLPCLHTFCESCLGTHISKTGPSPGGDPSTSVKGFHCPCCRRFATNPNVAKVTSSRWPQQFPVNGMLADLVELHSLKNGRRTCDPCSKNNASSEVTHYCKNCRAALCESCMKTHRGLKMSRKHKVLSTAEFSSEIYSLKVEEQSCQKHDKPIEQYCSVHSKACCSSCVAEEHRSCDKVVAVAEAAKNCRQSQDVTKLEEALDSYRRHTDTVLKNRSTQMKQLESKKSKMLSEFAAIKKHVMSQLEKLERDMKKALEQIHARETKKVRDEVQQCREIQAAVANTGELLEVADNHGSSSQLLDTVDKTKKECELYEENIGNLCSRIRKVDYEVTLDQSLEQSMRKLDQFGRVDVTTAPSGLPPHPKVAGSLQSTSQKVQATKPEVTLVGKDAQEISQFSGKLADDSKDCWFTSAKFLPDGNIVLADRVNRRLKLFTSGGCPLANVQLSSKPWDVTVISNTELAVTLPSEHRIQFLQVGSKSLCTTRSISLDEPCFGLHYVNKQLLTVTYDGDPPQLKVYNMDGNELTYICSDDDGFPLFSKPLYVTSNKTGSQLYVSDERLGCIVNLTEAGHLNFTYSAMDLGHAAGLAVDDEGNIYACGNASNAVHQVSSAGDRVKVLMTGDTISYPRAIAVDPKEKRILVTQGDKNEVKLYSLQ